MSMELKTPIISIIVPVYNAQAHLRQCLASIRAQRMTDWEAILVDDGSTDGSAAICDETANADPRFTVIHKQNAGVSNARNDGIEAAKGDYLMFIEADDLVTENYCSEMLEAAKRFDADLVLCGFDRFNDEWEKHVQLVRNYAVLFRDAKDFLLLYTESRTNMFGVSIWAKLFRTDLIKNGNLRFDPSISYEEDCNFIADCVPHLQRIVALGESMYRYRQQEESLSKGYRRDTFRFLVHGYNRRCALLKRYGLEEYLSNAKGIFFGVVKNACIKIANSDLPHAEKLREYEALLAFEEVRDAVVFDKKSKSGLSNRICAAIKAKDAKRLDRVMRSWKQMDRVYGIKNDLKRAIKNHGKKEQA